MVFSEILGMFDFMLYDFSIQNRLEVVLCLNVTKARGGTSRNVVIEMFSFTAILVLPHQLEN